MIFINIDQYFKADNAGGFTITTTDPDYLDVIGEAEQLSFRDVEIVNKMYRCPLASK